jgi:hypothetical protein
MYMSHRLKLGEGKLLTDGFWNMKFFLNKGMRDELTGPLQAASHK